MFFKKIIHHKYFWPILTFILIIPAFSFLLKPGYYNMHDDMQMIRQLEMEKCLADGQIPCRWTPDLGYGYGYPLFNFYPPMPYMVGQVYRTLGFTFINSVKATAITQIILSAAFIYLLSSSIFGPIGGFLSSIFYTYAPYHALNIYVRGAMNEAWAAVFFPLIFYFSRKLVLQGKLKYLLGLSISFTCLLLSHNPMALTFVPILFAWVLFWFFSKYQKPFIPFIKKKLPIILKLAFSGLLAGVLAAFYTIPVIFETKLVQINTMFEGYYHFSVHFATLYELFIRSFWGDGASVWGPNDDMSFSIGYLHWIIPILILGFIIWKIIKYRRHLRKIDQKYWLLALLIIMGFITVFMTHNKSTFIWLLLPTIQKIQFPWRFLNHSVFLFSLSIGGLALILKLLSKDYLKYIILSVISILLIIINVSHFTPVTYGPITDEQKFSGKAWVNQITSGIYDYLPKTAKTAAKRAANPFVDEVDPNINYQIDDQKQGSNWTYFKINLDKPSKIILSQLAFPNFTVTDNNQPLEYSIEPELGRIVINLSAGDHQIFVKFVDTPIRTVSNYISLFGWIFVLLFFTKPLWKRLIYRK